MYTYPTLVPTNECISLKMSYIGHVVRGNGLELLHFRGNGYRLRGRPQRRWIDELRV